MDLSFNDIKLKYNFDTNLYRLLNNDPNPDNSIRNIIEIKKFVNTSTMHIYSLRQILENLPIDFDINQYARQNRLFKHNKYEVINHYIHNNKSNHKKWIELQLDHFNDVKTFAIVFPQFHEIPENNKFWGKGFTDWCNVKKTFQIHNKHLPIHPHNDIGYYNILDLSTRKRWNDYAEEYGFYGYIFYHYWFSTGIVMNKPLDKILEDGQPDKPWFLSWANENWTKRWDGQNNDVLLSVDINMDLCVKHFNHLLKYFKHKNYYKVNNKPCLGVYIAANVAPEYINMFNKLAIENGFDGITFISTLNNRELMKNCEYNDNYCEYEFEFPPNYSGTLVNSGLNNRSFKYYVNNRFSCNMDIQKHYVALSKTKKRNKKLIRGIMPSWDNFPRHHSVKSMCHIQLGSNSLLFYLLLVKQFLLLKKEKGEYLFLNALNEWAEQCALEPSIENDYSYLEALQLAKKTDLNQINEELIDKLLQF
jgi:hypothetical protein